MLFDTFKELDRISSAFFSGFPESALSSAPINLYREDDRYVVEADLPGFDPSSIDVSAEAGLLHLGLADPTIPTFEREEILPTT